MKKEIKDKLIEVANFCICVIVLFAIAYFTGFINGFTFSDIRDAYNKVIYNFVDSISKSGAKSNLFDTSNTNSKRISSYKNYYPMRIPDQVLRGANSSGAWKNVFYSNKKVVFYTYNASQLDFHNSVSNYLSTGMKAKKYNLIAYSENSFNNMRAGDIGISKICDSLQECDLVRQKASDYVILSDFMKRCGKYMCIINPNSQQYVKLRNKNSGQAVKMIFDLINW